MTENRASTFVTGEMLLNCFVAETGRPEDYSISTESLAAQQADDRMMGHGDTGFRVAVDEALGALFASGEIPHL